MNIKDMISEADLNTKEAKYINNFPWKPVILYMIFGFLWILFSDRLLEIFVPNPKLYQEFQTIKGWLYVIVTGALLYYLIKLDNAEIYNLTKKIAGKNDELVSYSEELIAMEEELQIKVTSLEKLTEKISLQKDFLDSIYDNSNTALLIWDLDGNVVDMNKHFTELLGYDEGILDKKWFDVMLPKTEREKGIRSIHQIKESKKIKKKEIQIKTKDNEKLYMVWNDTLIQQSIYNKPVVASFGIDLTSETLKEKEIEKLAFNDSLTSLKNRLVFEKDVKKLIKSSEKFTAYFIDVDNFKKLNEIHGHKYGDEFLKKYAVMLSSTFESIDIYRWESDEFLLIQKTDYYSDIDKLLKKLLQASNKTWVLGDVEFLATVSIGIARYPIDAKDFRTLFKNLNVALHKAKENGKSRYEFYRYDILREVEFRDTVETKLNLAINNDELHLNFQPIYYMDDDSIRSFEILLRWNNEAIGDINIGNVISIAEQTGQIIKIDHWVIKRAFSLMSQHNEFKNHLFSINVSPQTFNSASFLTVLKEYVELYDIDTSRIVFEITEHTLIDDIERSKMIMKELKIMNFKIALDDFGTRYSSLNYLSKLPFDVLKLDKSYIDYILENNKDQIIIKQIIKLAKALGLKTIAEGIERVEQKELLMSLECDYGQGYYLSRPLALEKALSLMEENVKIS